MTVVELEKRVSRLENQVNKLLDALSQPDDPAKRTTNIDRIAGFFGNDPVMKRIMQNALDYREQDRRKARRRVQKSKRAKS